MKKVLCTNLTLLTSAGTEYAPMKLTSEYNETEDVTVYEITLTYSGQSYSVQGDNFSFTQAFVSLEKSLAEDVKIASCLTCRHGNLCPYSGGDDEVFCTKDLIIRDKTDMCNLFNSEDDQCASRLVRPFDYCGNFVRQSDDYYTYNDFLYYLRNSI